MEEDKIYNVPTYIEKAVKKYVKLKDSALELIQQIEDYKSTHGIPAEVSIYSLKHIPEEDVDPNQVQMDLD